MLPGRHRSADDVMTPRLSRTAAAVAVTAVALLIVTHAHPHHGHTTTTRRPAQTDLQGAHATATAFTLAVLLVDQQHPHGDLKQLRSMCSAQLLAQFLRIRAA